MSHGLIIFFGVLSSSHHHTGVQYTISSWHNFTIKSMHSADRNVT